MNRKEATSKKNFRGNFRNSMFSSEHGKIFTRSGNSENRGGVFSDFIFTIQTDVSRPLALRITRLIFPFFREKQETKSELFKVMADDEGTLVAKGKHVVPKGVAVEELDGGVRKFTNQCPLELTLLLKCKGARQVYDHFVAAVIETRKTRHLFGFWMDTELNSVLDLFRDKFAKFGIKVALCKRCNKHGRLLWLEFVDTSVQPGYVPQYDVANMSGQTIRTLYTALEFAGGVAVKVFNRGNPLETLRDKIPEDVERLLIEKGLLEMYYRLVQRCILDGVDERPQTWNNVKLVKVVAKLKPRFQAKGVDIFICYKTETISLRRSVVILEYRWLEFVDLKQQPNYHAQRDATTHKYDACSIM